MTQPARVPEASPDAVGASVGLPWTCPFCALHCDRFKITVRASLELIGSDCPKARASLAQFSTEPASAVPLVGGSSATLEQALDAATASLARARQPLIGGLATDVAGARAAFRLAEAIGAIVDHLHGASLMHTLRAIQDRGIYYTTLAEIRNRADLIVCIGTNPSEHYPEFFRRCGIGEPSSSVKRIVFVGAPIDPAVAGVANVAVESVALQQEIYATLATVAAAVSDRPLREYDGGLVRVAEALRNARYSVIVWEAAQLDEHGALAAETIDAIVGRLNGTTRAASFTLGGNDGAYTANQVFTWLSGLPLRTALHRQSLDHEPVRHSTERLLRDASVDALVWISSFAPQSVPPGDAQRLVVLGHPAMATSQRMSEPDTVFIPVSTPGIGSPGHMFRLDGGIALPLRAIYADTLPTAAQALDQLTARLTTLAAESRSVA